MFRVYLLPTAHEMQVEMKNELPAATLYIKDQFIPRLCDSLVFRDFLGSQYKVGYYRAILIREIINTPYMSFGNQKDMYRRVRLDVLECHD
jgi:hypothetical protein